MVAKSRPACCLAAAFALWTANPASAVVNEGGSIRTDGAQSTVNRHFFLVDGAGEFQVGAAPLTPDPPPFGRPALTLYRYDDPLLSPDDFVLSASAPGFGISASATTFLPVGQYVAFVSQRPLAPGNFGPLNRGAPQAGEYAYDFVVSFISGTADSLGTCLGNLDSTFSVGSGNGCRPVFAAVPSPAALGLLGFGLLALLLAAPRLSPAPRESR